MFSGILPCASWEDPFPLVQKGLQCSDEVLSSLHRDSIRHQPTAVLKRRRTWIAEFCASALISSFRGPIWSLDSKFLPVDDIHGPPRPPWLPLATRCCNLGRGWHNSSRISPRRGLPSHHGHLWNCRLPRRPGIWHVPDYYHSCTVLVGNRDVNKMCLIGML